jgi:hypothetical protein
MARWFLILLSGCSLTLSGPDPNRPRNNRPACDTSKAMVALDGAMAAALGLVAVGLASNNDGSSAVAPALIGSLFLVSAIHGNSTVDSCNRELASFENSVAPPPEEPVAQLRAPVAQPPSMQPPMMQPPVVQPQPAAIAAPPAPQPQSQPPPSPRQPPPPQTTQGAGDDPWADFWQEVP